MNPPKARIHPATRRPVALVFNLFYVDSIRILYKLFQIIEFVTSQPDASANLQRFSRRNDPVLARLWRGAVSFSTII
jgi:hypothetical protein